MKRHRIIRMSSLIVLCGISIGLYIYLSSTPNNSSNTTLTTPELSTNLKTVEADTSPIFCNTERKFPSVLQPSSRNFRMLYIAHTLGLTPNGTPGTNTKEAFEHSYAKGFRLFEADILRTKDNHLLIAHERHEPFWGISNTFDTTLYEEVKGATYADTYTTMDLRALLQLLQMYDDTYIILDIKFNSPAEYDDILSRIIAESIEAIGEVNTYTRLIPQIYTPEDIARNSTICNFSDIIFTQYRNNMPWEEVLRFLTSYPNISAVAAPYPHRYRDSYVEDLVKLNRAFYVHPITDAQLQDALTERGIGVYTSVSTTVQ